MNQQFNTDGYEHHVCEALFLIRCARSFARRSHALKADGREVGAELERHRACVYRHKARKELNAARQFQPH